MHKISCFFAFFLQIYAPSANGTKRGFFQEKYLQKLLKRLLEEFSFKNFFRIISRIPREFSRTISPRIFPRISLKTLPRFTLEIFPSILPGVLIKECIKNSYEKISAEILEKVFREIDLVWLSTRFAVLSFQGFLRRFFRGFLQEFFKGIVQEILLSIIPKNLLGISPDTPWHMFPRILSRTWLFYQNLIKIDVRVHPEIFLVIC